MTYNLNETALICVLWRFLIWMGILPMKTMRWVETSFFNSFKILTGRHLDVDLSLFSDASVGVVNNNSSSGWQRKSWNDLYIWKFNNGFSFSCNWTKIVIKDVNSMQWISYILLHVCVSIFIFDSEKCLIAIKFLMPFHKFLRLLTGTPNY